MPFMRPRTRRLARATVIFAVVMACPGPAARAQGDSVSTNVRDSARVRSLQGVQVIGRVDELRGVVATASQGHVGAADLRLRPLMREGELLESVPGVIVTQHSGDGKSNQLFVRGFNLDHGTDFQTRVDGMPVNMASHAHGQGYTDLNFLIPEFVEYIDYSLGVSHAAIGDFGSAGGAEFQLRKQLDRPFFTLGAGAFGFSRAVGGTALQLPGGQLMLGGEARTSDGPWQVSQRLRKFSGIARYSAGRGTSRVSLLALAYRNSWAASDQIPARAVYDGRINRFGQVDPTLGGETSRYSLSTTWNRVGASTTQTVQLFGIASALDLYSNFTYFLQDERDGDQFNQREGRVTLGANVAHRQQLTTRTVEHTLTLGLQHRTDRIDDIGLHRTRRRVRIATVREDDVSETSTGVYAEIESRWTPRLRSVVGLRGDAFTFDVNSRLPANSGQRRAGIMSPKLSLAFTSSSTSELYLSGGFGFHSNDARGATITIDPATGDAAEPVDPLVRSRGGEIGIRLSPNARWRSTAALWALDLDSELLFVGDGGTTEPSNASHRAGVTIANFYRPIAQLSLDADVSFSRARLRDVSPSEDRIPGSLEHVVAAGVTWTSSADRAFATMRIRHFGAYPLVEDNRVRATATTLINASAGLRIGEVRVQLSILNLVGTRANDIQYFYASRLAGEPLGGVEDVHFHPVEPRQLRLSLSRGL